MNKNADKLLGAAVTFVSQHPDLLTGTASGHLICHGFRLSDLADKQHKFVSSEEALQDVVPPQWSEDVLSGKEKAVVDVPKMKGCFRGTFKAADFPPKN